MPVALAPRRWNGTRVDVWETCGFGEVLLVWLVGGATAALGGEWTCTRTLGASELAWFKGDECDGFDVAVGVGGVVMRPAAMGMLCSASVVSD
jgi:hypothetical protein